MDTKRITGFVKVRFTSVKGSTPGLVFTNEAYSRMTLGELSSYWPAIEANKMVRVQASTIYLTNAGAAAHEFDIASGTK